MFRSNKILLADPVMNVAAQLSPGPGRRFKRATAGASAAALALGGASLALALITRAAVLEGDFASLDEGNALRERSNLALGTGLGLSGAGLALAGASMTMYFAYPPADGRAVRGVVK